MSKQLFIGIDVGSSGVRVEVYDEEGNLIAVGRSSISKQDINEWIEVLRKAMPHVVKECINCEKHVSIDSTSGTFIAIDKRGEVLYGPVMYYEKKADVFEEVKNMPEIQELAKRGITTDATSPYLKILYMKRALKDIYINVHKFVPAATWLLHKLCYSRGEEWSNVRTDYTNALKFGLDITTMPPSWFKPLFEALEIDLDKLPGLAPSGEFICRAKSELAEEIGLKNASVYQGLTDGNAAALAGGALDRGDVNIYTGSTTVPKAAVDKIITHPALYYHIHPLYGYLAGSATGFTGAYISWFAEKILGLTIEEALRYAEVVEAGTEYLFFPYGDRGPFYDSLLMPALANIAMYDQPREIVIGRIFRSLVLGVTLLENIYLKLFENVFGVKIAEVNLTGGGSKSKFWNRLRASVYEKRVVIHGDLVGVGTIIPVLYRSGLYTRITEIKQRFLKPVDFIEPDKELASVYKPFKERFESRWMKLRELYRD
uniref:Carbohydrate kinase FGGY N-terminal domain-containing protein n=1 Tax=Ignisphaera aggregans TaxID=334771 RepID=A0A7J2TZQ3_9CREN